MKKTILRATVPLKASLLLFGFFLVLAVAFHPTMTTAQTITVSCNKLKSECSNKCSSEFGSKEVNERIGCVEACGWNGELCLNHLREVISVKTEICKKLYRECDNRCEREFVDKKSLKFFGYRLGCKWHEEFCDQHSGEVITP